MLIFVPVEMVISDADICPGAGYMSLMLIYALVEMVEMEGSGSGHSHCLSQLLFSIEDPIAQECSYVSELLYSCGQVHCSVQSFHQHFTVYPLSCLSAVLCTE